tara:strand:- start:2883 stop:3941 length:1059 start_codon:yes stop_codon:yes gene_type:complete
MVPMLSTNAPNYSLVTNASAADACNGDIEPPLWNQTVARSALVPHYNYYDMYWGFGDYDDDDDKMGRSHESKQYPAEAREPTELNPEEGWMYQNWDSGSQLQPLTSNHHTTMLVGNDSIGALRVNLSAQHRTTVCISLQSLNETDNDYSADVYLMTTSEYERYTELYYSYHSQNSFYWDIAESLSEISPEWRSMDFTGWRTYRDAHQYESVNQINFALNLDGPESYTPIFGSEQWQNFYIVIDTWDNNHDSDSPAPGVVTAADVTIITTERSFILPNYTVALVFLLMMIGVAIFPFILNARYMKSGLEQPETMPNNGLVPSLERPAELPPMNPNEPDIEEKSYPELEPSRDT